MKLRKTTKAERSPQRIAVVNKAQAKRKKERNMLWAATLQWHQVLELNRITGWRLSGHFFSTISARAGFHSLWQPHLHLSLEQAACLLDLHDQLTRDP